MTPEPHMLVKVADLVALNRTAREVFDLACALQQSRDSAMTRSARGLSLMLMDRLTTMRGPVLMWPEAEGNRQT